MMKWIDVNSNATPGLFQIKKEIDEELILTNCFVYIADKDVFRITLNKIHTRTNIEKITGVIKPIKLNDEGKFFIFNNLFTKKVEFKK